MLFVLRTLPPAIQRGLRVGGGLYLLALAWSAFRDARLADPGAALPPAPPRTLLKAVAVNLLNPNPYIGWAFVLGPAAIAAWREAPTHAVAFVLAFYATMVSTLGAFIVACAGASMLGTRLQRGLLLASAVVMACLGVWQIVLAANRVSG